jgi:hypothetical protein
MTAASDQCEVIRRWLAIGSDVYPDTVVISWIRMAEEALSKILRCKDNLQIDTGLLVQDRYLLPSDWRELDFVRIVDGRPLRYAPRDDFYNPDEPYKTDQKNCYTLSGNYVIVGGTSASGLNIEVTYYQDVSPLGDNPSWLLSKYPTLFTLKTLHIASMYAIEDDRGTMWDTESGKLLADANKEHASSKASGSRLTQRHVRSFG